MIYEYFFSMTISIISLLLWLIVNCYSISYGQLLQTYMMNSDNVMVSERVVLSYP